MFNLIGFLVIFIPLALIIVILSRKARLLKEIRVTDFDRENQTKYLLLEKRLKRQIITLMERIKLLKLQRSGTALTERLKKMATVIRSKKIHYLLELRGRAKTKASAAQNVVPEDPSHDKLNEVRQLLNQKEYETAEHLTIELIKQEPKCLDAYKVLAEIYWENKDFIHAEATWEHIHKLGGMLKNLTATDLIQFADAKLKVEKFSDALQAAKKAIILEPLNPKILHFLTKVCILCHEKDLAWKYYRKLKEANGENDGLNDLLEDLKKLN